jgi:hypothetical protein
MAKEGRYKFPNPTDPTAELIKRRRLQILVHSCIYYVLDTNIISDYTFDKWAKELEQLLKDHPGLYGDRFDFAFEKWDSASGFDLPLRDPWIMGTAQYLVDNTHP